VISMREKLESQEHEIALLRWQLVKLTDLLGKELRNQEEATMANLTSFGSASSLNSHHPHEPTASAAVVPARAVVTEPTTSVSGVSSTPATEAGVTVPAFFPTPDTNQPDPPAQVDQVVQLNSLDQVDQVDDTLPAGGEGTPARESVAARTSSYSSPLPPASPAAQRKRPPAQAASGHGDVSAVVTGSPSHQQSTPAACESASACECASSSVPAACEDETGSRADTATSAVSSEAERSDVEIGISDEEEQRSDVVISLSSESALSELSEDGSFAQSAAVVDHTHTARQLSGAREQGDEQKEEHRATNEHERETKLQDEGQHEEEDQADEEPDEPPLPDGHLIDPAGSTAGQDVCDPQQQHSPMRSSGGGAPDWVRLARAKQQRRQSQLD
jgi:hypothetical protein